MKRLVLCLLITTVSFAQKIKTGADNYAVYLPLLKGKSIGIYCQDLETD